MNNVHKEKTPGRDSPNISVDQNMHEGDVAMKNNVNGGNLPQNEGLSQVAESRTQTIDIGQANVTEPMT